MPVVNLSHVTTSLETLFRENIEERMANAVPVLTSSVSPLDIVATTNLVNVFLFHLHPEGKPSVYENRSIMPPVPASFSKPLTLYYHLTVHHNGNTDPNLTEQDILGHAMATLLDHTQLDETLFVGGTQVFANDLTDDDNAFELEVISKSANEALTVWAGYEGGAIRPSLYFKVKNVNLRPQAPVSFAGPILSIGNLIVPNMGPKLFSAQSTITAIFPGPSGPVERRFKRTPAELFIGAGSPDQTVLLRGASIDPFVRVELSVQVGSDTETIRLDFTRNGPQGWGSAAARDGVRITWGNSVEREVGGLPSLLPLEPGPMQLRVIKQEFLERDGARVPVEIPSNKIALTLNPHIAAIAPTGARRFQITLDGDYDLNAMAPASKHGDFVRLAIGGALYEVIDTDPPIAEGQCAITGTRSIDFVLPLAADETAVAYVQLWVRDSVSQPFWIGGGS